MTDFKVTFQRYIYFCSMCFGHFKQLFCPLPLQGEFSEDIVDLLQVVSVHPF